MKVIIIFSHDESDAARIVFSNLKHIIVPNPNKLFLTVPIIYYEHDNDLGGL